MPCWGHGAHSTSRKGLRCSERRRTRCRRQPMRIPRPPRRPPTRASYLRQDAPSSPGVSDPRPRRSPAAHPISAPSRTPRPAAAPRAGETTDHKKLIVGRRSSSTAISLPRFPGGRRPRQAVLNDCRQIDIASSGQSKGSVDIQSADISGRFDGDLTVHGRSTCAHRPGVRQGEVRPARSGSAAASSPAPRIAAGSQRQRSSA